MTRIGVAVSALLLMFVAVAQVTSVQAANKTLLRIEAVSIVGDTIPAEVSAICLQAGEVVTRHSTTSQNVALTPGRYLVEVAAPGFAKRKVFLDTFGTEMHRFLRVGLNVGLPARLVSSVKGRVEGFSIDSPSVWIKLVPVLNNGEVVEMPLHRDGSFEFRNVPLGPNVLLVSGGNRLLAMREIDCCQDGRPVNIVVRPDNRDSSK